MRGYIVLALYVLGAVNARVITIEPSNETSHESLPNDLADAIQTLKYMYNSVPAEHRDNIQEHRDLIEQLEKLNFDVLPPSIWDETESEVESEIESEKQFMGLAEHVLEWIKKSKVSTIVKREAESDEDSELLIESATEISKTEKILDTVRVFVGKVQLGTELMKNASNSSLARDLFKVACRLAGVKVKLTATKTQAPVTEETNEVVDEDKHETTELAKAEPLTSTEKPKKSLKMRFCTAKTFKRIQYILKTGHKAMIKLNKLLSKKNIKKVKSFISTYFSG